MMAISQAIEMEFEEKYTEKRTNSCKKKWKRVVEAVVSGDSVANGVDAEELASYAADYMPRRMGLTLQKRW